MEAYMLDDAHSFEDDGDDVDQTDGEEDEGAVAEFVSEMDDKHGQDSDEKKQEEDEEEQSQQFSLDDVTDDESGDEEDLSSLIQ